ncbi:N-glycosidase [Paenibacillus nuruki]|uniref:N-glycosidase n=1 Tax=Paenibacillus nuruki TaxID=1886670 RepID=A0A1E3L0M4_9BACL|nr:NADAR family protein [Paenibacillus nuruki]ODP27244.1 N-glycosidase [Paenibacillus nuruki]
MSRSSSQSERFLFFYRDASPFSQWYPASFELEGQQFTSAEQYMMYGKAQLFGDRDIAARILQADHPRQQKALGRQIQRFDDELWNREAKNIVYRGNHAKFTQNPELLLVLLATAGQTLVEASPTDRIWGIGLSEDDPRIHQRATWRGTNWLGEVLTQLREDLLSQV